ncbi:MAG TPA: chorismate synthase [Egibacteraceae bacterium]|nr:chorismate synthase [Egibacteraceae bacterium]
MTLRYLTAGESHGAALVGILEGMPAGVPVDRARIERELERRRLGHGRSPRMNFEQDRLEILGGVVHGRTLGSPIAIVVHNSEWPKWTEVMSPDPVENPEALRETGRGEPLTRPRPGHADLAGMQKYGFDEARPVLERASARETAARVGLACFGRFLLEELGIRVLSHVVRIGEVAVAEDAPLPGPDDLERVDADPVRCFDADASARMVERIDRAKGEGDTLGGVVEVVVHGLPPGLGSHVHWDRKLDARLAAALMSIQSVKGVEAGEGFRSAEVPGSKAHDEIVPDSERGYRRVSGRSGGIEGGMSTGEVLRVRAAMKPISSIPRPLRTVDVRSGDPAEAIHQRSDACAVPRGAVVAEHVVALELAGALLEKTGGDSLEEVRRNLDGYVSSLTPPWLGRP